VELQEEETIEFRIQHSRKGVHVQDRSYLFKTYYSCFIGSEAVDWIMNHTGIPDRERATAIGQGLMDKGIFAHVTHSQPTLRDENFFYRFAKHDKENRLKAKEVDLHKPFKLNIVGYSGCSYCENANKLANEIHAEIGDEKLQLWSFVAPDAPTYKSWLSPKRKALAMKSNAACYHTTSPLIWATMNESEYYIGGLDNLMELLHEIPSFAHTKAMKSRK